MKLEQILPSLRVGKIITRKKWITNLYVKYLKIDNKKLEIFTGRKLNKNIALVEISFMDTITPEDVISNDWILYK